MALIALSLPILPGKKAKWQEMADEMSDPSLSDFAAWAADVHGVDPDAPPPAPRLIYDSHS